MKRNHTIREEDICRFSRHLHDLEYAPGSIEKYLRDLTAFQHWLAGRTVTQREIAAWKEYLHSLGCRSETVNTKLSALNRFFAFQGWSGLRARYYRIQRRFFRSTEREMTREDCPALCAILQDPQVMYAYEHAFSDEEVRRELGRLAKERDPRYITVIQVDHSYA